MADPSNTRTIEDFGEQWSNYGENDGFYASLEILEQIFGPLAKVDDLKGKRVADIGSGTGRIVQMILQAGASHVLAVEPSVGVEALRRNTADAGDRVEILNVRGDELPAGLDLDYVISIGVIQFIEDPVPTLRAALEALRPGGRLIIWVYSLEGNRVYVTLLSGVRTITTRLPHAALDALCNALSYCVDAYIFACRFLPLPMRDAMLNTHSRLSRDKMRLTIYDQLNPSYAKYYRESELRKILDDAGFTDLELYHRDNYSWTAMGSRPEEGDEG